MWGYGLDVCTPHALLGTLKVPGPKSGSQSQESHFPGPLLLKIKAFKAGGGVSEPC